MMAMDTLNNLGFNLFQTICVKFVYKSDMKQKKKLYFHWTTVETMQHLF